MGQTTRESTGGRLHPAVAGQGPSEMECSEVWYYYIR